MLKRFLLANLNRCIFVYNFAANSALYLFYSLVPHSEFLQGVNRDILWRLFKF